MPLTNLGTNRIHSSPAADKFVFSPPLLRAARARLPRPGEPAYTHYFSRPKPSPKPALCRKPMSELDQYDYTLPRHLIAQNPAISRIDARLLVVDREHNLLDHRYIRDLPEILRAGDCLVLNDTKVIPARLLGYRADTGGRWEGLFLETAPDGAWHILSHTRGKLVPGEPIVLLNVNGKEDIRLVLAVKDPDGTWIARPESGENPFTILDRVGRVPLPPYIRDGEMLDSDREDYQTVFARVPGAVAAPTAGLHFTESLLRRLKEIGVIVGA